MIHCWGEQDCRRWLPLELRCPSAPPLSLLAHRRPPPPRLPLTHHRPPPLFATPEPTMPPLRRSAVSSGAPGCCSLGSASGGLASQPRSRVVPLNAVAPAVAMELVSRRSSPFRCMPSINPNPHLDLASPAKELALCPDLTRSGGCLPAIRARTSTVTMEVAPAMGAEAATEIEPLRSPPSPLVVTASRSTRNG